MSVQLSRVRLPQRRKDILRRVRLLDALHRNVHRKLTFVSAPAGYGKTALLLDFASGIEAAICWYSIGPDHIDLVSFAEHVIASFRQNFPGFGEDIVEMLTSATGSPDPYRLAAAFCDEFVRRVPDFCLLILDDFHFVGEAQAITSFVEALLDNLPDHVRLLIASRSVYGIPSANLFLRDELATIATRDLRFRPDELQTLVKQNYRLSLSSEQAATLAEVSDGWIVALLLATRALSSGAMPRLTGATEQIYSFLAQEVLDQLPDALRDLLFATAILDTFDDALAAYMLDAESASDLIRGLVERNLFLNQIETADGIAYQYHQLFAEFLQSRLRAVDPARASGLRRRAAEWFIARESWDEAVRHLLAAGDRMSAAALMDRVALPLYLGGHVRLLGKWVEALRTPPDILAHAPRLALSQAKILSDQGVYGDDCTHLLDLAEARLRSEGDSDQLANVILARGMIERFCGRWNEAFDLGRQAETLVGNSRTYRWYQTQRLQGVALGFMNDLDSAVRMLDTAAAGFRLLNQTQDLAEALNDLGIFHLQQGAIFPAQSCFLEVLEIRRNSGNSARLAAALNNAGYLDCQMGRYREAWMYYEEALHIAQTAKFERTTSEILNGRGDLLCDLEEWDLAQAAYSAARQISETAGNRRGLAYTYSGLSNLEALRGKFNEALFWLREAARYRNETPDSPAYQMSLGTIYLEMGQAALASETLNAALSRWDAPSRPTQEQTLAEFLLARAQYEEGQPPEALDWLKQSLQHAARLGYDQFLVVAGRRAKPLLDAASQAWPANRQIRSLIQRIDQFRVGLASVQAEPVPAEPARPMRLEIIGFGTARVRRDGDLIPATAWRSSGSRALFFYIADRGGAAKDDIALEFWPDFSAPRISSNLHATLWRVRNVIGRDVLVHENDRYKLAPHVAVWYDVAEFESLLKQAEGSEAIPDEQAEMWRQAVGLYEADYLTDILMDWTQRRRDQLQTRYLGALTGLAGWEMRRSRYRQAREWYERVVSIDPYHDQAYAGIMQSLIETGNLAEARATFIAYKRRLAADLDAAPSPLLQALYERTG